MVVDSRLTLALGSMLVVLAAGLGARRVGLLTPPRRRRLNAFAYYVALPALIFSSTYDQPLSRVVSGDLVVGVAGVLLATAGVAWVVHRRLDATAARSVAVVQSYHTNLGYLGVPVVAMTFGDLTTAKAGLVLGVGSLIQLTLTLSLLSAMNGADASPLEELAGVARNPMTVALVAGLGGSAVGLRLPDAAATGVSLLGDTALPIALLCVGAALTLEADRIDLGTVGSVIGVKVVVMPLLALAAFTLLAADPTTVRAGVVMFAMPTAVSTYVFASELGGDRNLASLNVFATTVVSVASLLVVVVGIGAVT